MELSILLMKQIFAMVLIMLVGFAFVKLHMLKESDSKILAKIILYAACPCTIVNSFMMDYSKEKAEGLLIGLVAAFIVHVVFIFLGVGAERLLHLNVIEKVSLVATNAGYILIPLVSATLGNEYVFYCSAFIAVQTIFFWTYLLTALGQKQDVSVKKILLNPNVLAIALGMVLFFGRLKLPVIFESAVTNIGNATGALSMMVIGMAIGSANLKEIFTYGRAYLVCFGRLFVYPVVVILLIWVSRVCVVSPIAQKVLLNTVLASAAPVATAVTQFAELYNIDAKGAGIINVLSVFLCIISMPTMVWLYQVMCG